MPFIVWLLLGGMAAYLIAKSGAAAASSAAVPAALPATTMSLGLSGPSEAPGPYVVPVESSLPPDLQNQLTSFFVDSDQPSFDQNSVATLAQQLAENGYTIAAGSVMSAWQMIVTALNAVNEGVTSDGASGASSSCPPGMVPAPPETLMQRLMTEGHGPACVSSSAPFIGPPVPHELPSISVVTQQEAEAPVYEEAQVPAPTLMKI